jgi:transcriptional regulator with XRE-family HTH domain/quercetin dioxygenase-like cupin family protein
VIESDERGKLIGRQVRQRRVDRGWTLDQLAERSGVSRRMLVNIEQGSANPSIATLLRVSDGLGVGLPVLVDVDRPAALRVTRSGHAPVLWHSPAGGHATLVAGTGPPDVVELWDWTLGPGDVHRSEPHATGTRELLLVLSGQVELHAGEEAQLLKPGDSAAFHGDLPHGYAHHGAAGAQGDEVARFTLAVFEPHVGSGGIA